MVITLQSMISMDWSGNMKSRVYVADFETTVYAGQVSTEVWAAASVELFTEDVIIHHSIAEQFSYFRQSK